MPYPHLSRVTYGLTGDLTFELPARPWIPANSTIGGRRIAGSGIPAAYMASRFRLLRVPLRFEEWQYADVEAFIEWAQGQETFRWYPVAANTDEDYDSFAVYLQNPAMGEDFEPTRDGQYQRQFDLTIVIRSADGSAWTEYFPAD